MVGRNRKSLVISDLDNTLFDWFGIWYGGFRPILTELSKCTGVSEDDLIPEIKKINESHGTSEYAFLIDELPILKEKYPPSELSNVLSSIREKFERGRAAAMSLYPTVRETLQTLKTRGCVLIGYTESMAFYSNYRLRKLGLDDLLDFIYSPPDHVLGSTPSSVRFELYSNHIERLKHTQQKHTPLGEIKPNPGILRQIVSDLRGAPRQCVYVGDSLMKDIAMAQDAGVDDVWAKYGVADHRDEYELLRRVTHWTSSAVELEKKTSPKDIKPTFILERQFSELLQLFDFESFEPSPERPGVNESVR